MPLFTESFDPSNIASWGDWFLKLSLLFFLGGGIGWILEFFYRRIAGGKWVNPGFLTGPMLPIYGFGNVCMYILCSLPYEWVGPVWAQKLVCLLFIGFLMTFIEFLAGLIFIKGMKIMLWDYSNRKGNIMGIICPLFSLIWLAIGAGYLFLLYDPFASALAYIVDNPIPFIFLIGLLYGFLFVDLFYSFQVVAKLKQFVEDKNLVLEWEKMKTSIREFQERQKSKRHYVLPFAGEANQLKEAIGEYMADLKTRYEERKQKAIEKKESKKKKD